MDGRAAGDCRRRALLRADGLSVLEHLGLPEFVVRAVPEYARIELAGDAPRVAASPLCDGPPVARELEDADRAMPLTWTARG